MTDPSHSASEDDSRMRNGSTGPSFLLKNVRIVEPGKKISAGDVFVQRGQIADFGVVAQNIARSFQCIDGRNRLLTPGLIDIHTHGILQYLYASGRGDFMRAANSLGQFGVTTVVPTIVPQVTAGWLEMITEIVETIPRVRGVNVHGVHLEGPFMAIKGSAAETLDGDIDMLEEIITACRGRLNIMSLSPETPDIIPIIRRLRENNTAVFITHTCASVEQTEAAFSAGANHATHFYDVFYSPPEIDQGVRPAGAVEAVLADRSITVDFIADGIHVHPAAIRAAIAAKGHDGVILITDAIIGAGLPPDTYDTPWGFQVRVRHDDAPRHATENYLAGSSLTMNRGMANLLSWLDLPEEEVWAMGTSNPARVLGLEFTGRVEVGADADLVLWEENMHSAQTWVRGESVYRHGQADDVEGVGSRIPRHL